MRNTEGCGIYEIRNTATGRVYIGATKNFSSRMYTHIRKLGTNQHPCKAMQEDWNEAGASVFEFRMVRCVEDAELLREAENEVLIAIGKETPVYNTHTYSSRTTTKKKLRGTRRVPLNISLQSPEQRKAVDQICYELGTSPSEEVREMFRRLARKAGVKWPA